MKRMLKLVLLVLVFGGITGTAGAVGLVNPSFESLPGANGDVVKGANGWAWLFDPYTVNDNPGGSLTLPAGVSAWMPFTNHPSSNGSQHLWLEPTGGAIRQTLGPIAANTVYTLTLDLRGPAPLSGVSWADIDLSAVEVGGAVTNIATYGGTFPTVLSGLPGYVADQWYAVSLQFDSANFPQHVGKPLTVGTFGAYVAVDNYVLTPEPATMILLGVGGLALLRRKRV